MVTTTLATPITDLVLFEDEPAYSRERVVIAAGHSVQPGMVLARLTAGAVSHTAKAGNAGNGILTMNAATPLLKGSMPGAYTLHCIAAAVGGGTFRVHTPDGEVLGDVAVGATFANQIDFSIAAGAADFVVGDAFTITVARGSGKYVPFDPAGIGGVEVAAAMGYETVDATTADARGVILARTAVVDVAGLIWPATATADDIATAIIQLESRGIIARAAL